MPRYIYWDGKQAIEANRLIKVKKHRFCVDTLKPTQYGRFIKRWIWKPVPFDCFPAKFKAHLLLLGVL